jgi:hypothetical protein
LLAGAIAAVTPHLWQSSAVVMSDTTGLAVAAWGSWSVLRWARGAAWGWLVLGATLLACAIDVRWVYGLVAGAVGAGALLVAWSGRRAGAWRDVLLAGIAAAFVLAPVVVPMAVAFLRGETPPFSIQLRSHAWDPSNALRTEFSGPDGTARFAIPMGAWAVAEAARPYYLGPLLAACALGGAARVVRHAEPVALATLLAWPLLVIGLLAGDIYQNTRFFLAGLPPVAILAAIGVTGAAGLAARSTGRRPGLLPPIVAAIAIAALGVQVVGAWRFTDAFITRQQADLGAVERLGDRVPHTARLISFGATLALRQRGRDVVELYDLDPEELLDLVADGQPSYLLVQEQGLVAQWASERPGRAFTAIRDGPGLRRVEVAGAWTLFAIGRAGMRGLGRFAATASAPSGAPCTGVPGPMMGRRC